MRQSALHKYMVFSVKIILLDVIMMKISRIVRFFIILVLIISLGLCFFFMIKHSSKDNLVAVYLDDTKSDSIPSKNDNYVIDKIVCDNDANVSWNNVNWLFSINDLTKKTKCNLYFKSKKDITITYDNNYIKNNIFNDTYDISNYYVNDVNNTYASYINYKILNDKTTYLQISNTSGSYEINYAAGIFLPTKNSCLSGSSYTISFEVKGNDTFDATIGSEQDYVPTTKVNENWQKVKNHFNISSKNACTFVVYNWVLPSVSRTLELRNIELQEGEYDNYSNVTLKEYDSLGSLFNPIRSGYTFLGWYTDPVDGDKVDSSTVVTEDTTYYAHWQYNG